MGRFPPTTKTPPPVPPPIHMPTDVVISVSGKTQRRCVWSLRVYLSLAPSIAAHTLDIITSGAVETETERVDRRCPGAHKRHSQPYRVYIVSNTHTHSHIHTNTDINRRRNAINNDMRLEVENPFACCKFECVLACSPIPSLPTHTHTHALQIAVPCCMGCGNPFSMHRNLHAIYIQSVYIVLSSAHQ